MAPTAIKGKNSQFNIEHLDGGIFQYHIGFNGSNQQSKPKITCKIQKCNNENGTLDGLNILPSPTKNIKSVRFNLQPKVHLMHVWNFACKQARKDFWQQEARDRVRFEKRVNKLDKIIAPILIKKQINIHVNKKKSNKKHNIHVESERKIKI